MSGFCTVEEPEAWGATVFTAQSFYKEGIVFFQNCFGKQKDTGEIPVSPTAIRPAAVGLLLIANQSPRIPQDSFSTGPHGPRPHFSLSIREATTQRLGFIHTTIISFPPQQEASLTQLSGSRQSQWSNGLQNMTQLVPIPPFHPLHYQSWQKRGYRGWNEERLSKPSSQDLLWCFLLDLHWTQEKLTQGMVS